MHDAFTLTRTATTTITLIKSEIRSGYKLVIVAGIGQRNKLASLPISFFTKHPN